MPIAGLPAEVKEILGVCYFYKTCLHCGQLLEKAPVQYSYSGLSTPPLSQFEFSLKISFHTSFVVLLIVIFHVLINVVQLFVTHNVIISVTLPVLFRCHAVCVVQLSRCLSRCLYCSAVTLSVLFSCHAVCVVQSSRWLCC